MKIYIATAAAALMLGATLTPALADDQPSQATPPKTMGDEGKLPATSTVGSKVPEMGATEPTTNTGSHTMGDTGKLPATGTVGGAVPDMTAPDPSKK